MALVANKWKIADWKIIAAKNELLIWSAVKKVEIYVQIWIESKKAVQ